MMAKLMKCITEYEYPVFESNQILSSVHLNDLRDYVDEGNRATRVKLSGYGIVCGLEVEYNRAAKKVSISKGYGISTDGYFIGQETKTDYSKYKRYTCPEQPVYPAWLKGGGQIRLWELFTGGDTTSGTKSLGSFDAIEPGSKLQDMVVVLFLEARERELKSCTGTTCDNKGKKKELSVRVLLAKRSDLDQIELEKLLIREEGLDEINISRLSSQVDLSAVTTYNQLANAYKNIFDTYKVKIAEEVRNAHNIYAGILGLKDLDLKPLEELKGMTSTKNVSQYEFDLLKDIVLAYDEFREAAYELKTDCCSEKADFPRHLMLGQLKSNNTEESDRYRNYFLDAPVPPEQDVKTLRAQWLFMRILSLIKNFGPAIGPEMKIKITPSREDLYLLSQKSIPYYYKDAKMLSDIWDPEKSLKGKSKFHLSYNEDQYNKNPVVPHIRKPLDFDLDEYGFFRIEGHLGHPFRDVIEKLDKIRKDSSLPFDLIALKLKKNTATVELKDDCGWRDIENEYINSRNELVACLHTINGYMRKLLSENDNKEIDLEYMKLNPKKIMEQVEKIISLLTECIVHFKFDDFYRTYRQLMRQLKTIVLVSRYLLTVLIKSDIYNLTKSEYQQRFIKLLMYIITFQRLINSRTHIRLLTVYYTFLWRINQLKKNHLSIFSNFAEKHSGMEHKAGVPKGGTFIIVYTDNSASQSDRIVNCDFTLPYRVDCCCDIPPCDEKNISTLFPPLAEDDIVVAVRKQNAYIYASANDGSLNRGNISISKYDSTSKNDAKVVLKRIEGREVFIYTAPDKAGIDTFHYEITDSRSKLKDSADVIVLVVDDPGEDFNAADDIYATDRKTPVSINVMHNDLTGSGAKIFLDTTKTGLGATIKVDGDHINYKPEDHGLDTFQYRLVENKTGRQSTATVTVIVYCCEAQGECKFPTVARDLYLNKTVSINFRTYEYIKISKVTGATPEIKAKADPDKNIITVLAVKPFRVHTLTYYGKHLETGQDCKGSITLNYKEER
jgi:hypothetical protein